MSLQNLVDDLAGVLSRPVNVDDLDVQVLAVSAQIGVDQARTDAILHRRTNPAIVEYAKSFGISRIVQPIRIPGKIELSSKPRVCIPLLYRGRRYGYLWLIDEPKITAAEIDVAWRAAEEMAQTLADASHDAVLVAESSARVALNALHASPYAALDVLTRAEAEGLLPVSGEPTVFVCNIVSASTRLGITGDTELRAVLADMAVDMVGRGIFVACVDRHAVVVIAKIGTERDFAAIVAACRASARRCGSDVRAIGTVRTESFAEIPAGYRRARFACRIAPMLRGVGHVASWEDLGLWSALMSVPWSDDGVRRISPAAAQLISQRNATLWHTVLTYLDTSQDIVQTCTRMNVHRATLYYRLDRAKAVIGADVFDDGWQRTSLHVALALRSAIDQSLPQDTALHDGIDEWRGDLSR
ncbi:MAG: helix-turn-helix domain-containing protein [Gordonia sp. (in: high G+C Gram-positive bacteria)]